MYSSLRHFYFHEERVTRFSICISTHWEDLFLPAILLLMISTISIQYHYLIYSTILSNTTVHCYPVSVCTHILSLPIYNQAWAFSSFFIWSYGIYPQRVISAITVNDKESGSPTYVACLCSQLFRLYLKCTISN